MIWKPVSEITERMTKFDNLVHELKDALKDNFVEFDTYYGYRSNELSEAISDIIPSECFEDVVNDDLVFRYLPDVDAVRALASWIANWDMVVLGGVLCAVKASNHPDAAKTLNKMFRLCISE